MKVLNCLSINMQISMRMNMDDEAAVYISFNDGATTIGMHDPIVERLLDDPHHHAGTYSFPSSSSSSPIAIATATSRWTDRWKKC